jgi:serine/threonine protein kinase
MTEAKTAGIMKQVCAAVDELHSQRIIHRDIKPENIVIHDVSFFLYRILSSFVISDGRCIWIIR